MGKPKSLIASNSEAPVSGYWVWDLNQEVIYGDPWLSEYFNLPGDALTGVPVVDALAAIVPEDRERVIASIEASIAADQPIDEEYRVATRSRGVRRIRAVGRCFRDSTGSRRLYPGWFADVTDQTDARHGMADALAMVSHAKAIVSSGEHELIVYLLECAIVELEREIRR